jgi:cytidylate kinase
LISIEGPAGIGKSTIVKRVAHLIYERNIMKDGVIYLSLKD